MSAGQVPSGHNETNDSSSSPSGPPPPPPQPFKQQRENFNQNSPPEYSTTASPDSGLSSTEPPSAGSTSVANSFPQEANSSGPPPSYSGFSYMQRGGRPGNPGRAQPFYPNQQRNGGEPNYEGGSYRSVRGGDGKIAGGGGGGGPSSTAGGSGYEESGGGGGGVTPTPHLSQPPPPPSAPPQFYNVPPPYAYNQPQYMAQPPPPPVSGYPGGPTYYQQQFDPSYGWLSLQALTVSAPPHGPPQGALPPGYPAAPASVSSGTDTDGQQQGPIFYPQQGMVQHQHHPYQQQGPMMGPQYGGFQIPPPNVAPQSYSPAMSSVSGTSGVQPGGPVMASSSGMPYPQPAASAPPPPLGPQPAFYGYPPQPVMMHGGPPTFIPTMVMGAQSPPGYLLSPDGESGPIFVHAGGQPVQHMVYRGPPQMRPFMHMSEFWQIRQHGTRLPTTGSDWRSDNVAGHFGSSTTGLLSANAG